MAGAIQDSERQPTFSILMLAPCPFPANHGTSGAIRELSTKLAARSHNVHVVTYPQGAEDIPVSGLKVHRVFGGVSRSGETFAGPSLKRVFYDLLMIWEALKVLRSTPVDVIHAHSYEGAIVGAVAKFITRKPLVYNAVNTMADELPSYDFPWPRKLSHLLGRLLDYVVPRSGDLIMALSDDLKEYLLELGVPEQKTIILPLGVDTNIATGGDGEKVRRRLGYQGVRVVLYAGTLETFQRIDYLLQAFKVACSKRDGDMRLLILNNVPNRELTQKYADMSERLGIDDCVTFVDDAPLNELNDYLAAADVAVISRPSCPGHPVKLLNYMSAGKAIACFKSAGKGLHHMHNAYVAPDGDYQDLGWGIAFLLENAGLRDDLGLRARRSIFGVYDWDTLVAAVEQCYAHLLEPKRDRERVDYRKLAPYLKRSYVLQFTDRRVHALATGEPERRNGKERRRSQQPIAFLERRHLDYPRFCELDE